MWQFLHSLASFRGERCPETESVRPQLETLEGRQLLSGGSVSDTIVASYSRGSLVGMTWQNELGVSRFDPQTGDDHVLFNKVSDSSPYGGESIGQVAAAGNGDVIVAVNRIDWMHGIDSSKLQRIDVKTGASTPLFTTEKELSDYAVAPNGSIVAAQLGGLAMEISRFDPHTGARQLLASEPMGIYDSAGQVAVAADGDVIFSVTRYDAMDFTQHTDLFRYDEQTKTTSPPGHDRQATARPRRRQGRLGDRDVLDVREYLRRLQGDVRRQSLRPADRPRGRAVQLQQDGHGLLWLSQPRRGGV